MTLSASDLEKRLRDFSGYIITASDEPERARESIGEFLERNAALRREAADALSEKDRALKLMAQEKQDLRTRAAEAEAELSELRRQTRELNGKLWHWQQRALAAEARVSASPSNGEAGNG